MRRTTTISALAAAMVLFSTPAPTQQLTKGVLSGPIQTFSATVGPTSSATVFTTPGSGFFIVTQWCSQFTAGTLTAGSVALLRIGSKNDVSGATVERCANYIPGAALPQGTAVTFTNPDTSPQTVTVTGVLSSK